MAGSGWVWRNWAGNQQTHPRATVTPQSAEEVAAAVRDAGEKHLKVRMTGTGHSFTPTAVAGGLGSAHSAC
jgi:L-gulonolactone oxidase